MGQKYVCRKMKRLFTLTILFHLLCGWILAVEPTDTLRFVHKLHGQTRKFQYVFIPEQDGGVTLHWGIERNLKWWSGTYRMSPKAVSEGKSLSFRMPEDGNHVVLPDNETFAMISRKAYDGLIKDGEFGYDGVLYKLTGRALDSQWGKLLHVEDAEGAKLWILDNRNLPLIVKMSDNPLEINWTAEKYNR